MQLSEMNDALWTDLAANGVTDGTPAWLGVRRALGVGTGEDGDAATHPLYGFTIAALNGNADSPLLVLFLLTPGRLVRYEWTKQAAATTTVPLDRVAGVEESETAAEFAVSVHVDGHTRVFAAVTEPGAGEGQPVRSEARSEGLTWRIAVPVGEALALAEFSRRLRLLLGV